MVVPAEVAPGVFKAVEQCTDEERASAIRIAERKSAMIGHWWALAQELEETWVPRTPLVMAMGLGQVPAELPLSEVIADVERLEAVLEMKRRCAGSDN